MPRPRRPRLAGPCLALALALAALAARADRGIDPNRLKPATDSYGLLVTERAQVPAQWETGVSLYAGYTHRPLTVPTATLIHGQVSADLALSFGLFDFLSLSALLPVAAQGYNDALAGELAAPTAPTMPTTATGLYRGARSNISLSEAGPRDPRLALKGRLWRGRAVSVALLAGVTIPVGNSESFLGERGFTFRPTAIVDGAVGRLSLIGNLGATVRPAAALADPQTGQPALGVSHELTFAAGASLRALPRLATSLEVFGAVPLTGSVDGAPVSADVDLLGAAWFYATPGLRLGAALGGSVLRASPRHDPVRALLGVTWAPAPRGGGLP